MTGIKRSSKQILPMVIGSTAVWEPVSAVRATVMFGSLARMPGVSSERP